MPVGIIALNKQGRYTAILSIDTAIGSSLDEILGNMFDGESNKLNSKCNY